MFKKIYNSCIEVIVLKLFVFFFFFKQIFEKIDQIIVPLTNSLILSILDLYSQAVQVFRSSRK